MKRYIHFLFFVFLISTLASCKKFVEVPKPQNLVLSSDVFADDKAATSAMVGLYSEMMKNNNDLFNGGLSLYPGLSSDEIVRTSPSANIDVFFTNSLQSDNQIISNNIWRVAYKYIYHANSILENLNISPNVSKATKQQLLGEAKFIRALTYFYLTNLFGDVPLLLTTDYRENAVTPRSPSADTYQQVIKDLQEAQGLLLNTYPTTGRVRPNKWTATTLLARVYLYRGGWVNAESEATAVITAGQYSLVSNTNIANAFLAGSTEAIWQLLPTANSGTNLPNTAEGFTFVPSSATARPDYALTSSLFNSFDATDSRKTNWIKSVTVSSQTYNYPFKYKVRTGATITEYNIVFRLAELYLIRAEARARQDNIGGAQADLNLIRNRAGLPNTTAATKDAVLMAIETERRKEFFCEWGHRWFDLKRTNRADIILMAKPGWAPTDALYPIPLGDLQTNPFLTQNPGY